MKFKPDWPAFYAAYLYLVEVSKMDAFETAVRDKPTVRGREVRASLNKRIHQALIFIFSYVEPEEEESNRYSNLYSTRQENSILWSPLITFVREKGTDQVVSPEDFWDACFQVELKMLLQDLHRCVVEPMIFFKTREVLT